MPGFDVVRSPQPLAPGGRLHLDFRPDDQVVEAHRCWPWAHSGSVAGTTERPWVVPADLDGNEFWALAASAA